MRLLICGGRSRVWQSFVPSTLCFRLDSPLRVLSIFLRFPYILLHPHCAFWMVVFSRFLFSRSCYYNIFSESDCVGVSVVISFCAFFVSFLLLPLMDAFILGIYLTLGCRPARARTRDSVAWWARKNAEGTVEAKLGNQCQYPQASRKVGMERT